MQLFSQETIGYGGGGYSGWLYHRNEISIGDFVQPNYNLLLTKYEIGPNQQGPIYLQIAYSIETTGDMRSVSPTDGFLVGINKDTAILNQQANSDLIFKTNATNRAVIKNNGYVGIGIMNPQHDLHVHGNGTIGGHINPFKFKTVRNGAKSTPTKNNDKFLGTSNISLGAADIKQYAAIQLTNNATGTEEDDRLFFEIKDKDASIRLNEDGNIYFNILGNIIMSINKDKSIGIGTTVTNGYKLAVKGTAHFVKIVVNIHDWSDEVFEDNYKLKSLYELENYIKTNKHLPGIPSESEVKKNGIDVADMNKRLLQKVEELTLYIIDLQKQIDELKKQLHKQ